MPTGGTFPYRERSRTDLAANPIDSLSGALAVLRVSRSRCAAKADLGGPT